MNGEFHTAGERLIHDSFVTSIRRCNGLMLFTRPINFRTTALRNCRARRKFRTRTINALYCQVRSEVTRTVVWYDT